MLADRLELCLEFRKRIENQLADELPIVTNQGGMFRTGVHQELDELRKLAYSGKDYFLQIQQREIERTGIAKLKIAYNKVFGYYLEVSNSNKDRVPTDWIRKQTLVNAERYITEELKVYEEKILTAEGSISTIESNLFEELVNFSLEYVLPVQQNARVLAQLDCLFSFAQISETNKYAKPILSDDHVLDIKEGRHPVIEQKLKAEMQGFRHKWHQMQVLGTVLWGKIRG